MSTSRNVSRDVRPSENYWILFTSLIETINHVKLLKMLTNFLLLAAVFAPLVIIILRKTTHTRETIELRLVSLYLSKLCERIEFSFVKFFSLLIFSRE